MHVPSDELGREDEDGEADERPARTAAPAKKKTRRGSSGGKNRRKPGAASRVAGNGGEPAAEDGRSRKRRRTASTRLPRRRLFRPPRSPSTAPQPVEEPSENGAPEDDWGYVPMSEWGDELK